MAKLEMALQAAQPFAHESIRPYRCWTGRVDYNPNMRRALVRRRSCLSLLYLLPDSSTPVDTRPSRWDVAAFGPGYGAPFTPTLESLWDAYARQPERQVCLEEGATLGMEAVLVSEPEAHHLVLLFILLEPRDDRRVWHHEEGRSVE